MQAIDSLVQIVDFVVQGLMVLFVTWFTLRGTKWFDSLLERIRTWLVSEKQNSDRTPKPTDALRDSKASDNAPSPPRNWLTETVLMTAVIGGSYALGLITNSVSFLALEPAHETLINNTINKVQKKDATLHVFSWPSVLAPLKSISRFFWNSPDKPGGDGKAHVQSLCEQVAWQNQEHEVAQTQLDPLVKQLRVLRGAVICLFTLALVSFLRVVTRLTKLDKLLFRLNELLFSRSKSDTASTKDPGAEPSTSEHQKREVPQRRWGTSVLIGTSVISFLLYVTCLKAWTFVEAEYHLDVYYGVRTAIPKDSTPMFHALWKAECPDER